jgi:hypothetical protein
MQYIPQSRRKKNSVNQPHNNNIYQLYNTVAGKEETVSIKLTGIMSINYTTLWLAKKKTVSINHTTIISINYATLWLASLNM